MHAHVYHSLDCLLFFLRVNMQKNQLYSTSTCSCKLQRRYNHRNKQEKYDIPFLRAINTCTCKFLP